MRKISSLANGRYFEVKTSDELMITLSNVAKTENVTQSFTYKTMNELLYDKFLLFGSIMLALAWIIKRLLLNEMI